MSDLLQNLRKLHIKKKDRNKEAQGIVAFREE